MLTTKMKSIVSTKDSVEGLVETTVEMAIGTNEPLDEVPERLAEVEAIVDDLIANDDAFKALDIYQQAEDLELGCIFGKYASNQHFPRNCYLDLLVAKRDGKLEDVKSVALAAKLERDAVKPVDKKLVAEEPVG